MTSGLSLPRPSRAEVLTAVALVAAPFVLEFLGRHPIP